MEQQPAPSLSEGEGRAREEDREVHIKPEYLVADPAAIDLSSFSALPLTAEQPPLPELCGAIAQGEQCRFGDACQFNHNAAEYLVAKPAPVRDTCPFEARDHSCPYGLTCLCGPTHDVTKLGKASATDLAEQNFLSKTVQQQLRQKKYDFSRADAQAKQSDAQAKQTAREQRAERHKLDWRGKLVLAPLTTVGNLPFRRLCVALGADVTLGEMALAQNLVKGERQEWSLLRRHRSESVFGVQLAGAHLDTLTRAVQLLTDAHNDCAIDFIDLNVGCPIDLITKKGMGCALVTRPTHLTSLLRGMVQTAQHVPVTVKLRIGAHDYSQQQSGAEAVSVERRGTIHRDILPQLHELGVAAATVHGRSHRQRYLRSADWQYIAHCSHVLREHNIPLIGNGDIYNWEQAAQHLEHEHATALMIARSALIKPWIFTEIKERRHIDYTATQRWQLIAEFVSHGLEHWGSDRRGVETTRRFLLEWLSFTHRYIPIGLLQHAQPISIHHRAAGRLQARDQFETILSSPLVTDWQTIAAWFLGPAPCTDTKTFKPTHAAGWQDQQNG